MDGVPFQTKFPLGQIVATPGALDALRENNQEPLPFLQRHAQGDWGDVSPEDAQENDLPWRFAWAAD